MLPLLKLLADKEEHNFRYLIENLSQEFNITDLEKKQLLSSGNQTVLENRVAWAKTYLKKSGLLEYSKRGTYRITSLGLTTLDDAPSNINFRYLKKFPSFLEFQSIEFMQVDKIEENRIIHVDLTPEETLDEAYQLIRKGLAVELLAKVLELSPEFFERLVVELIVKMGYGGSIKDAGQAIGKTGDEGIDGTIKEDKLGLDVIYIQAKRWKPGNTIGRPEIQKFVGALAGQSARKGIFITTSSFSKDAYEYVSKIESKIVLLNGTELAELMIEYNLGCTVQSVYEVKKIDNDYFNEE